MARGYPDWYRGFDTFGGMVRVGVLPAWGAAQHVEGSLSPTAVGYYNLITKSGQGMLLGGIVRVDCTSALGNDWIRITLDGNVLDQTAFNIVFRRSRGGSLYAPVRSIYKNATTYDYMFEIRGDYIFRQSLAIDYYVLSPKGHAIDYWIYYCLAP